jgi:hypothetical protein
MNLRQLTVVLLLVVNTTIAQQWSGSATVDGLISRNGNLMSNGLYFGRYGGPIVGDANPYCIYSFDSETHELLIYGSGAATLNLRMYDGDIKIGSSTTPNSILYNNGGAYFGNNVGVGTLSPQGSFQVSSTRPIIIKSNGGNGVYGSEIGFNAVLNTNVVPNTFRKLGGTLQHGGAAMVVDYTGNMFFQMYNAATVDESIINYSPQIAFLNNGSVGIGTTTPTAKLDVPGGVKLGSVAGSPAYTDHVVIRSDGNMPTEGGMIFTNSDAASAYGMKLTGSYGGTNNPTFRMGVVNLAAPNNFTRDYLFFNDNKMGVRTITPLTDLHISSQSLGGKANDPSPSNGLLISCDGSGTALNMGVHATGPQYSWIQSRSKATAATPLMMNLMINPWGGNVAIGTTTADQKLTVDGTVKCEEVLVEVFAGTGPDYVFAPDYNLLPLSEVESYIKANQHLPEVPSAKQMEEEGLNLKEMNLLLLKKVEELTLHLIEMEKKVDRLEKEAEGK